MATQALIPNKYESGGLGKKHEPETLPHILMNSDANIYSSKNNFQSLLVRKILDSWKGGNNPLLKNGVTKGTELRVMDIGSGDGASTALLHQTLLKGSSADLTGKTVGMDILPTMVEFASQQHTSSGLSFQVGNIGDIQNLPKEWVNSFDLVVSFNCMHWLEDQVGALKNVATLLKPNTGLYHCVLVGEEVRVMIYAMDKLFELHDSVIRGDKVDPDTEDLMKQVDDYMSKLKRLDAECKFPWKRPYMTNPDPVAAYTSFMKEAGFTDVKVTPLRNIRFVCLPSQNYMNLVHTSFFPHLNDIQSPELRKKFIELLNKYCFKYNLKAHSSEVNHMSPEFYVVGRVKS